MAEGTTIVSPDEERAQLEELYSHLTAEQMAQLRSYAEGIAKVATVEIMEDATEEQKSKKKAAQQALLEEIDHEQDILLERLRIVGGGRSREELTTAQLTAQEIAQARTEFARHKEELDKLWGEVAKEEKLARKYKIPELYPTWQEIRLADMAEFKNLTTDNWSELCSFFEDALHEKNIPRASAIFRKLTLDGNENELTNWFGYRSDMQGMHDFVNEVLIGRRAVKDPVTGKQKIDPVTGQPVYERLEHIPKPGLEDLHPLYMGVQAALALENDMSYTAEKVGHWEVARIVKKDFGMYTQMKEEDHAAECVAEIAKTPDARNITRRFNRLCYGGEMFTGTVTEYRGTLTRVFTPSRLGFALLVRFGQILYDGAARVPPELNQDLIQKLADYIYRDPRNEALLRRMGVNAKFIDKIKEIGASVEGRSLGGLMEKVNRYVDADTRSAA